MGVFSCFSQAKTSKKNFFKLPFLLLWPNLVLFLSIFQLSPWTEAVIISPGLSEVIFSALCLPDTQCMGRHGASNKPLLLQGKLSPQVPHFYSILNFYIRVCEAGRVRAICSYLIFVTFTVWLWRVDLLPWLSLPNSRAEMSFISTASCSAYSWVNSPENITLTTALVCSKVSFPLLHHLQNTKRI